MKQKSFLFALLTLIVFACSEEETPDQLEGRYYFESATVPVYLRFELENRAGAPVAHLFNFNGTSNKDYTVIMSNIGNNTIGEIVLTGNGFNATFTNIGLHPELPSSYAYTKLRAATAVFNIPGSSPINVTNATLTVVR